VSETLEKSELDASLIVSGIVINLLMEEDLDINGEPEIILLENLNRSQWSDILPQIQYRIKLNAENHQAIAESGTAQIPVVQQELSDITLDSHLSIVSLLTLVDRGDILLGFRLLGFVCLVEECRQSNSRKNTDNDDNYQQFNQRKTFILSSLIEVLQELGF
jgi:hypothetical protein